MVKKFQRQSVHALQVPRENPRTEKDHVSASSSKNNNFLLINQANSSEEYGEEYKEWHLLINRVNILNLIDLIGKCL